MSLGAEPGSADDRSVDGRPAFQPPAIVVEWLRKSYGRLCAVDGVSFQVRRGEIYALLGPNGAGKTATGFDPNARRGAWEMINGSVVQAHHVGVADAGDRAAGHARLERRRAR